MKAIELTFTAPHADEIIGELVAEYKDDPAVVIGAGTVLDPATARIAIIAGASSSLAQPLVPMSPSFATSTRFLTSQVA